MQSNVEDSDTDTRYGPSGIDRVGPWTHRFFDEEGHNSEASPAYLLGRLSLLYFDEAQTTTLIKYRPQYCKPRKRASKYDSDVTKEAEKFLREMGNKLSFPLSRANITRLVKQQDDLLLSSGYLETAIPAHKKYKQYGLESPEYHLLRFALLRCGRDAEGEFLKGFLLDVWLEPFHTAGRINELLEKLKGKASKLRSLPSSSVTQTTSASSLDGSTTGHQLTGTSGTLSVLIHETATTQPPGTVRSAANSFDYNNSSFGSPPSKKVKRDGPTMPKRPSQVLSDDQSMQPVSTVPDSFAESQNAAETPETSVTGASIEHEVAETLLELFEMFKKRAPPTSRASRATGSRQSDSNSTKTTPTEEHLRPDERARRLSE